MAAGDPYWNNVVLAMHMDQGANWDPHWNSVIFATHFEGTFGDLKGKTVTTGNSAAISAAQAKFGTNSGLFVGASFSYMNIPWSSDFTLKAGDFTLEFFFNATNWSDWSTFYWNGGSCVIRLTGSSLIVGTTSLTITSPALATWHHFALSVNSNTATVYINGVLVGTILNWSTTVTEQTSGTVWIGSAPGALWGFNGYLDDYRITKGVGRYPAAFTPPTLPFSPSSLDFTDRKGHAMAAFGTSQLATAQSKFGGAAAVFGTSTANKVTAAASTDWVLGEAPFTIEFWIYPTAYNASQGNIIGAGGGVYAFNATTGLHWYIFINGTSVAAQFWNGISGDSVEASVALNTWQHFAIVGDTTSTTMYRDGVRMGGNKAIKAPSTTPSIAVGHMPGATDVNQFFSGYIDDLRITKGVARYTANFTPPVLAFPNGPATISGTVKDNTGALGPRAVRVHRKSDGALSGAMTSHSTTGVFDVPALDATPHYAIVHDSDADPHWANVVLATHFNTDSVIDPSASSVVFGLHMEGANASTVFTDTSGKTLTAAGTAAMSTDTARFGNSSGKFGTSTANKVTAAASADFALGGGPFTIELWVYATAYNASGGRIISAGGGTAAWNSTTGWHWVVSSNATGFDFQWWNGSIPTGTGAVAAALNTWHHLAFTFDGTTFRHFTNGVVSASGANTIVSPTTAPTLAVGELVGSTAGATNAFTGYLDDIRITKGVCRYTSTFTPPTVPFGSFKDLTGKDLMYSGVPSISTATKKYGDGALSVPGNGSNTFTASICAAHSSDFDFGANAFTIEMFISPTAAPPISASLLDKRVGSGFCPFVISLSTSAAPQVYLSKDNTTWAVNYTAPTSLALGIFSHLAYVRQGDVISIYINGALVGAASISGALATNTNQVNIAGGSASIYAPNGFIDDLRITKGVARYQADFTPPERAFSEAMTTGTANALIYDNLTPI